MDTQGLARGLISGLVIDQVQAATNKALTVAAAIGVFALVVALFVSGWARWMLGVVVLVALGIGLGTLVARWLAVKGIRRFAEPGHISQHRNAIDKAIDRAELPSGPVGALKLLWRLRRGTGPEIARLRSIVEELSAELDREPS